MALITPSVPQSTSGDEYNRVCNAYSPGATNRYKPNGLHTPYRLSFPKTGRNQMGDRTPIA